MAPVATERAHEQDGHARAWRRWAHVVSGWLDAATTLMLDAVDVGPARRVLDVAAGAGGQSVLTARRVGSAGHVLSTDVDPAMIAAAAEALRDAGLENASTAVLDIQEVDIRFPAGSFDAAICRLGMMYVPGPSNALAILRAGVLVYTQPEQNGFLTVPSSVLHRHAGLPEPPAAGQRAFSLAAPGALERAFERAGFRDVWVRVVEAPLRTPATGDLVRFEREVFGADRGLLRELSADAREAAWRDVHHALRRFQRGDRCEAPCELLLGVGTA